MSCPGGQTGIESPRSGEARLKVKRSKFNARAVVGLPAAAIPEVLRSFRTKHRKARHICWASRAEEEPGKIIEQMRDDGEVGRPGLGMLELLRRRHLLGIVMVARYFGGVKLGVGGVSRAFREVAEAALDEVCS